MDGMALGFDSTCAAKFDVYTKAFPRRSGNWEITLQDGRKPKLLSHPKYESLEQMFTETTTV